MTAGSKTEALFLDRLVCAGQAEHQPARDGRGPCGSGPVRPLPEKPARDARGWRPRPGRIC
jgi:hypothetical protein